MADERKRKQPVIAAARHRKSPSERFPRRHRQFHQAAAIPTFQADRLRRKIRHAEARQHRRIDAGVVEKSFFRQNVQRPQRVLHDRKIRRAVSLDRHSRQRLQLALRAAHVLAELRRREQKDVLVPVAVRSHLVALGGDPLHAIRKFIREFPQNETGGLDVFLRQDVEHALQIGSGPIRNGQIRVEGGLRPILDVDRANQRHLFLP